MPGIPVEVLAKVDSQMTPLIGAICGSKEDLALHLLALPGEELDVNRRLDIDNTIFHLCAESGLTHVVKQLVRRGADMDLWDDLHHTPICLAVMHDHVPLVRFLLKQYETRGEAELERALNHPCGNGGSETSLLGHVVKSERDSSVRVATARYLVREWGADPLETGHQSKT